MSKKFYLGVMRFANWLLGMYEYLPWSVSMTLSQKLFMWAGHKFNG